MVFSESRALSDHPQIGAFLVISPSVIFFFKHTHIYGLYVGSGQVNKVFANSIYASRICKADSIKPTNYHLDKSQNVDDLKLYNVAYNRLNARTVMLTCSAGVYILKIQETQDSKRAIELYPIKELEHDSYSIVRRTCI